MQNNQAEKHAILTGKMPECAETHVSEKKLFLNYLIIEWH
jgi:hypothetical protein